MKMIVECRALENYCVFVRFDDGVEGIVDLAGEVGKPLFKAWDDYAEFEKVRIDRWGALVWNEEVDMCPDALYLELTGLKPEDLFPKLQEQAVHA